MPISQSDQLFSLIKSLSSSEKKSFTLYVNRIQDAEKSKYIRLFELIDKSNSLDDDLIINKLGKIDKTKYANLKRHLYSQILKSLRLIQIHKISEIEVRELIDFSDILYSKGLVLQSLKILNKAKNISQKTKNKLLELDALEKIKNIESRHITRSGIDYADTLTSEAQSIINTVYNSVNLTNLKITLHAYYIKHGHIKNESDKQKLKSFYEVLAVKINIKDLSLYEWISYHQALVWYHYIMLDFGNCFHQAQQWNNLMKENYFLITQDPDLFMRSYHYMLTCAYYQNSLMTFTQYHEELSSFRMNNYYKLNYNSQITSFLYVHLSRYNFFFLKKDYSAALDLIPKTIRRINKYKEKLDHHRIMVLYYKIAYTYLMNNKSKKAIEYLHKIMTMEVSNLREDIQGYTRLMFILAHFSSNETSNLDYILQNTKTYFNQMKETSKIQNMTIDFFTTLSQTPILERQNLFNQFKSKLLLLKDDVYEQRAFLYLDIIDWMNTLNKRLAN
jgi:hypothetical protein